MNLSNKIRIVALLSLFLWQSCTSEPENVDQLVIVSTRLGDFKLILYDATPKHKASFLELAGAGAYDSTKFYRVLSKFLIQGGDVAVHPEFERESRRLISEEFNPNLINKRGMIGAARQTVNRNPYKQSSTQFYVIQGRTFSRKELTTDVSKLNTALSKFLYDGQHQELIDEFKALQDSSKDEVLQQRILSMREEIEEALGMSFENTDITNAQIEAYTSVGGAPHLDGEYTVFGQVVEGMETVDKIAALEVDSANNPLEPVYMKLTVNDIHRDSITAWYNIHYPEKVNQE